MIRLAGITILQRGAALQLTVAGPVPVVLEVSGETLLVLLTAALRAFREQERSPGCARGGLATKKVMGWG